MRNFFTILVKENETNSLKLLTEKLNEGFYIDDRIAVGRSTLIVLKEYLQETGSYQLGASTTPTIRG